MRSPRILVVEDQPSKIQKIVDLILSQSFCDRERVDVVQNGYDARKLLSRHEYDLAILDVVLPNRPEEIPNEDGGVELLREIMSRNVFYRPRYVVGLTAFPDVFAARAGAFADYAWAIIQYEDDAGGWKEPIVHLLRHIFAEAQEPRSRELVYDYDICVITALQTPEYDSLMKLGWSWKEKRFQGDPADYMCALVEAGEVQVRVVAGCMQKMGMVSAALLSANMIRHCRPRIMAMTGICAGIRGKLNIGDVAVADPSWDYQSGKMTSSGFELSPHQLPINTAIRRRMDALGRNASLLRDIRDRWQAAKPQTEISIGIGPFASGSAVLANSRVLENMRAQHRQLIAFDMEAYGVYAAAWDACQPPPLSMVLKGVVDYGDEHKSDEFREYSSFVSAEIFGAFVVQEYPSLLQLWNR